ncbi:hypothetical protein [Bacillus toyonensis]|uniref:hypothetical protein n=1 Tax=Bacillus toyonensis TaxID=155322 RepID=UPI0021CE806E|nr:hypothetical protein [Bacillus toyonensis]MCU4770306.1 hypothetical protein [Bacillus toyonensis]
MEYSYKEFLEDLNMGREIHFIYKSESYYISNWGFWKFYDESSEIIVGNEEDILTKVKIDGKSIKETWNLIEVDQIF